MTDQPAPPTYGDLIGDALQPGNRQCGSCTHWQIGQVSDRLGALAECRRNPPVGGLPPRYHARGAAGDGTWPVTWAEDSCGEWKQASGQPMPAAPVVSTAQWSDLRP